MRFPVLLACVALSASSALADEAYEVVGQARGRPCKGVVVATDHENGETELRFTYRADVEPRPIAVVVGRGHRAGDRIVADVRPQDGPVDVLERLADSEGPEDALRLELVLLQGGGRWRVTLTQGPRTVVTGEGATRTEPALAGSPAASGWATFEGVPFVQGAGDPTEVHTSDPRQGQLGDCYLISGMIALARIEAGRERLRAMIVERGPGAWEVTLRGEGQFLIERDERNDERVDPRLRYDARVLVDRRLPVDAAGQLVFSGQADTRLVDGKTVHELWPNLIERAYAQSAGSYEGIRSGWPGDVFRIAGGTVARHKAATMTDAQVDEVLSAALREGHAICVSSAPQVGALGEQLNVVRDHSYALLEARGGGYVIYNPWGSSHPTRPLTAAELRALGVTIEVCAL